MITSRYSWISKLTTYAMARNRRRKESSALDIIPPIAGLIAVGVFISPQFRQIFGELQALAIVLALLAAVALIARLIWHHWRTPEDLPIHTDASDSNQEFRAAFGHENLKDPPKLSGPTWSQELLSELEWKRYEELVAAYSRELGYEANTTRIGADGGVDVKLFQNGHPNPVMIIQCKAWDAYKVGVKPVRELFGVMAADKVANGAFFTTGDFTAEAEEWAREKNLDLVNGREFLTRIGQLSAPAQEKLLTTATAGDYTTPTCPSCGVKMVLRTASKGRSEGSSFWGCRHYPRCKQTFRISQLTT